MNAARSRVAAAAALVALTAACTADPQPPRPPVWTDGDFDDWQGVSPAAVDPHGDAPPDSPVDLGEVAIQDDPRFLHFLMDLGRPVTPQGLLGSVELVLDANADAVPATGGAYGGVEGADMVVVLTRQAEPERDRRGAGVGVRMVAPDGPGDIEPASRVGLLVSPTHSSDRFELRLDRAAVARAAGPPLRQGAAPEGAVAGRLRYVRAGALVDETPIFGHALATAPGEAPPLLAAESVAKVPGTLRVAVWNVASRSFGANQDDFRRVVAALAPDVLLLDEIFFETARDDVARFASDLAEHGEPWTWWLASGGGRQRTAVLARGLEARGESGLGRIGYPVGAIERWLQQAGREPEVPGMAPPPVLARAEADGGLSATGAWVTVGGQDILFVPVDLQSAGYDGSPRDRLRELQARTLNQAIAAALRDRPGAGLVVAGDFNLVGSARPLDELRRGLGIGGRDLAVARIERLRDRSLATWRSTWGDGDDPFSPGRLDYLLYRSRALRAARAFVFDAADMSATARDALGILATDTDHSDHLPLVVDFEGG